MVLGIPDFRVFPDPYIDIKADHQKGKFLAEQSHALDFAGMVRLYWKITPEVSADRAELFMRHVFGLVDRGRANLQEIKSLGGKDQQSDSGAVLEIGCGTGGFLVAADEQFKMKVGLDIAFRWLVIAKKRFEELGLNIPLVCACAEHIPFAEGSFDLVVAENVLEHVKDQEKVLDECHRVLDRRGQLFIATPNRFSLTPEPHVRIWGVGFLPRRWMSRYVKLIKGIPYQYIRVLSLGELKTLLNKKSFQSHRVALPSVHQRELVNFSKSEKIQLAIYEAAKKRSLSRSLLFIFGPLFHVLSYARKDQ